MAVAEVAAGAGAAVLVGRSVLPTRRALSVPNLAEDFVLGLALVVPAALAWGLAGLPWGPVTMPTLALAFAGLLKVILVRRPAAVLAASEPASLSNLASHGLFVLCVLIAAWKLWGAPLWSWDHFAMWGMKARRLVVDGTLDLEFLKLTRRVSMNPQYPIGVPVAWRFLSPSMPGPREFRMFQALFAGALVAAFYACAGRLQGSRDLSRLASAGLCASPLLWDSANFGLAELPLAAVAVVAMLLLLEGRDDLAYPPWSAGAVLGFLGWIKAEGLLLGALLAGLAVVVGPLTAWTRERRAACIAGWAAWSLGAVCVRAFLLSPGVEFLTGYWTGRVGQRLREMTPILEAMLGEVTGREWFGLWFLFAAVAVAALAMRQPMSLFLALVVLGQLASYVLVYLGTFYEPVSHVGASFHRLAAGLAPLAILAVVGIAGSPRATEPRR